MLSAFYRCRFQVDLKPKLLSNKGNAVKVHAKEVDTKIKGLLLLELSYNIQTLPITKILTKPPTVILFEKDMNAIINDNIYT